MRLALVIAALAAIAVAHVHMEQRRLAARREVQRLQLRRVALRRRMWDQQIDLGRLTAPEEVRRRAGQMALELAPPSEWQLHPRGVLADRR